MKINGNSNGMKQKSGIETNWKIKDWIETVKT